MNKRIFVLDDEPAMVEITSKLLEWGKYTVNTETDPIVGVKKITADPPDLVILDISMDEMDGLDVCKALKANPKTSHVPIIFATVKGEMEDVVVGLEMGADDYIQKPLSGPEFLARVKGVLRRSDPHSKSRKISCGPLIIDFESYRAWLEGEKFPLTPKQFELLVLFMKNQGKVLTRATISEKVWGADFKGLSRTVDTTVDQLRSKLKTHRNWIQTLKGVGYRFDIED